MNIFKSMTLQLNRIFVLGFMIFIKQLFYRRYLVELNVHNFIEVLSNV